MGKEVSDLENIIGKTQAQILKEKFNMPHFRLTISGWPGAGKGTVTRPLKKYYGVEAISGGKLRREYAKQAGISLTQLNEEAKKDPASDIRADEYQRNWIEEHGDGIVESRLGYHFVPDSIKIFIEGNKRTLAERIMKHPRKGEEVGKTVEEEMRILDGRCNNDRERYRKAYQIEDCYDSDLFDMVINTTKPDGSNKPFNKVADLIKVKVFDYCQKAVHPKFYLAHPTSSREKVRRWELEFEKRTGIELINPFFEASSMSPEEENEGESKYLRMGKEVSGIFDVNLKHVARKDVIGTVVVIDDSWTWGTPEEHAIAWLMSKPVYAIVTHSEKNYFNHPSVIRTSNGVFRTEKEFETYMVKNKSRLFRELEKTRRKNLVNPVYAMIFNEIKKNEELLG